MKVRNKKLISILAMALISATSLQAYAVSPTTTGGAEAEGYSISPRWVSIQKISPQILGEGTTVSAGAYVKAASSTHKITGTYILEKKVGSSWSAVASWSFSGSGTVSVSDSYSGTSGSTYRTKVVTTVNGEMATAYSKSITI